MIPEVGREFCTWFYEARNDNLCTNVNMGVDAGQWCYVSSECEAASGGRIWDTQFSWKTCSQTQDTRLREVLPPGLSQMAQAQDLDLGLLHKESYPLYEDGLWSTVEAFWGLGNSSVETMPAALRAEMQTIADSGVPHSFDTESDHHPPHRIVVGMTVYAVEFTAPQAELDIDHPGSWSALSCLRNCE